MKRVLIYTRPGCHLCDVAKAIIQNAGHTDRFSLDEINIANDPELESQYKFDIPVITIDGEEAFKHKLTAAEFLHRIMR